MARGSVARRRRKAETITLTLPELPALPPPGPEVPEPRRFTADEVLRMAQARVLHPDERVELLDGALIRMPHQGPAHVWCVDRLTRWAVMGTEGRARVLVQSSILLREYALPQPDLTLVRDLDYEVESRHATGRDVLLLIEVGVMTVRQTRKIELPLYARLGVREVWLVEMPRQVVRVYRNPRAREGDYAQVLELRRGDLLESALLPASRSTSTKSWDRSRAEPEGPPLTLATRSGRGYRRRLGE